MSSEPIKLRRLSDGALIDLVPIPACISNIYEAAGQMYETDNDDIRFALGDVVTVWVDNTKYHYRVTGFDASGYPILDPLD